MTTYSFSNYVTLVGFPTSASLTPKSNTAILPSSLTSGIQVIARPGGRWLLSLTWENIYGDKYRELIAMLTLLNGAEHAINFAPSTWKHAARGDWGGTPVVDGGSQTGNTLAVRGADINTTDWVKAGDIFRIVVGSTNYLHMATTDGDSDGTGDVSFGIWPELRTSPSDGDAIAINQAGLFRLVDMVEFATSARNVTAGGSQVATVTASFVDTA